jgi:hypothetical protein
LVARLPGPGFHRAVRGPRTLPLDRTEALGTLQKTARENRPKLSSSVPLCQCPLKEKHRCPPSLEGNLRRGKPPGSLRRGKPS